MIPRGDVAENLISLESYSDTGFILEDGIIRVEHKKQRKKLQTSSESVIQGRRRVLEEEERTGLEYSGTTIKTCLPLSI